MERKFGRDLQGDIFVGTEEERFRYQHKEVYNNDFYHTDEFRRNYPIFGEFENFLQSQIQAFPNEIFNTLKVRSNQSEIFLQTEEADAASKLTKSKERHMPPRSFIIARDAFRWDRDRQRKETHNKIEKKRRTYINAKITELGNMLPDSIDRTSCNRKGDILKEVVEYMKKLQRDQELLKDLESKIQYLDIETRRMAKRLEFLEEQPVNNLTKNDEGNEDKPSLTNDILGSYQINSLNQSQMICSQTANSSCKGLTSDSTTLCTPDEKLNAEWNGLSAFIRDEDTIYYDFSPTFPDTLSNYF